MNGQKKLNPSDIQIKDFEAAVVEVHPLKNATNDRKHFIDIINSPKLKDVDIIVFPESILNDVISPILLPNSTVFCDDSNAHPIFRNISCAARRAKTYVVIDVYTKIHCAIDDQSFCVNKQDNTNMYNMAFVFDRNGGTVAKYRKFHLFNENRYVQKPKKPDLITFHTDFNVTFGIFVCFDLQFESPPVKLVDSGVRNFVYPTSWSMALPFMTAVQYQQSWAYANNVNLLAANANRNVGSRAYYSGSGIYAGRLLTLNTIISETPKTLILVASVPINLPTTPIEHTVKETEIAKNTNTTRKLPHKSQENNTAYRTYDPKMILESTKLFTIEFLDFSKRLSYDGTICKNDLCCDYDINVTDNGPQFGVPSYYYAITIFNGYYTYPKNAPHVYIHRSICGVIACGEMNNRDSCGKQLILGVHYQYTFRNLSLTMISSTDREKNIMPNTLLNDLYPLKTKEFEFKTSKLNDSQKYTATLTLRVPKSDLLTFAIFTRDYQRDIVIEGNVLMGIYCVLIPTSIFLFILMVFCCSKFWKCTTEYTHRRL